MRLHMPVQHGLAAEGTGLWAYRTEEWTLLFVKYSDMSVELR